MKRILLATISSLLLSLSCIAFATPLGIYWTDIGTGMIQHSGLGGSGVTTLVSGLSNPQGLFLTDNTMFWTDRDDKLVRKSNPDGTNVQVLYNALPGVPRDLFVTDNFIYMGNTGVVDSITRINRDGTGATALVTMDLSFPNGIDVTDTYIYWSDSGKLSIKRSDLNGSNIVELITNLASTELPNDVIVTDDYLYWTTRDLALTRGGSAQPGTIQRANLDGTGITTLVNNLVFPQQVVATSNYLFWTDSRTGKVQRSNLDGTNQVDIITGLTSPVALGVVTSVPEPATYTLFGLGVAVLGWTRRKTAALTHMDMCNNERVLHIVS